MSILLHGRLDGRRGKDLIPSNKIVQSRIKGAAGCNAATFDDEIYERAEARAQRLTRIDEHGRGKPGGRVWMCLCGKGRRDCEDGTGSARDNHQTGLYLRRS